jgi:hypothetical protein
MDLSKTLSLEELAQRCTTETERFFRRVGEQDNRFCYELFRRAFADRNDAAWSKLYQQYKSLVVGWILEHPQFGVTEEESDYFVNSAFTSMWRACPPERFVQFADLPAALAYLKSCVHTTILNYTRKRRPQMLDINEELLANTTAPASTPTSIVLDKLERAALWQLLDPLLHNEKERIVMEESFIHGVKPRQLYEQYTDHFATIQDVYRTKQNLLERLSRNHDLQQFYADLRENSDR